MSRNDSNVAGEFVIRGTVDASGIDAGMAGVEAKVKAGAAASEAGVASSMDGIRKSVESVTKPFTRLIGLVFGLAGKAFLLVAAVKTLVDVFAYLTGASSSLNEKLERQKKAYEDIAKTIEDIRDADVSLFKPLGGGGEAEREIRDLNAAFTEGGDKLRAKYAERERAVAEALKKEEISESHSRELIRKLRSQLQWELDTLGEAHAKRRAELEIEIEKKKNDALLDQRYQLGDERERIDIDYQRRLRALTIRFGDHLTDEMVRNERVIRDRALRELERSEAESRARATEAYAKELRAREDAERRHRDAIEAIRRGLEAGFSSYGGAGDLEATVQALGFAIENIAGKEFGSPPEVN